MSVTKRCQSGLRPDALHRRGTAKARVFAVVLLFLFASESPAEIFKYQDADGNTVFTDSPAPNAEGVEEIEPTINTGIPAPVNPGSRTLSEKEQKKAERKLKIDAQTKRIDDRIALRKELQDEVKAARKRLKLLEQERELSAEPRPEEIQHSAIRGNSWPKESYYKRLAEMDEQIEQAKEELAIARKNLRDMKRQPVEETE
ncbi:MAG: DUF4124 domain-containing protein [Candidatus Thiodiazotropha sp.]